MTPAERDMFAPKGMSKRIGPESGRTVRSGVSVFRSPYGSVRYMLSEDGEPLSVLQVVETAPGTALIAQVLTRPEFRRMGLASRLLERARKDYRQVLHSEHLTDEGAQWSKAVGNPGHSKKDIDVFSPKQVKAAFDNDGAFDRDSADVRKNPVDSLLVSQLAPRDVKRLNAMEAEWSRYAELADLAYEAGLTDEGDELSEAADAAADRLEDVISAIEESEASDHAEHELEGALFDAYEDFRRGGPTMGLSSEAELAKHARWHFSEHGVIVDSVSDRDIVDAVYDVWLWRKKLLNRVRR